MNQPIYIYLLSVDKLFLWGDLTLNQKHQISFLLPRQSVFCPHPFLSLCLTSPLTLLLAPIGFKHSLIFLVHSWTSRWNESTSLKECKKEFHSAAPFPLQRLHFYFPAHLFSPTHQQEVKLTDNSCCPVHLKWNWCLWFTKTTVCSSKCKLTRWWVSWS